MRAVQMSFDENLLHAVDREASQRGTTRSALIREVLQAWFAGREESRLEAQHKQGYDRYPVEPGEFDFADADRFSVLFALGFRMDRP